VLRKVLKVTVQWPLHLQDTEHRWDYARAITYRLRTVALAASARVCLRAERVQGLLGSGLEGRDHKLANLVRPRREGCINAIRHRRVRCPRSHNLLALVATNSPTANSLCGKEDVSQGDGRQLPLFNTAGYEG
jgi:hypothetical protein